MPVTPASPIQADYAYSVEKQAAWGTAIDTTPIGLPSTDFMIGRDPGNITIPRHDGTRGTSESKAYNDSALKIPTCKFSMPATPQLLTYLMPGILQCSTAYTAASDVWTMFTQQRAALPMPKATNEGYFFTLTARSPVASTSKQLKDAIMTSCKLSIAPDAHDGVLWMDTEWIGSTWTELANPSGTITQASLASLYKWVDLDAFTLGGQSMLASLVSAEFDITAGAHFKNDVPTGEVSFPEWKVMGKFVVVPNSATDALMTVCHTAAVSTGVLTELVWGDGTPSSAGEAELSTFHRFLMADPPERNTDALTFTTEGLVGGAGEYPFQIVHHYAAA